MTQLARLLCVVLGIATLSAVYLGAAHNVRQDDGLVGFDPPTLRLAGPLAIDQEQDLHVKLRNGTRSTVTLLGGPGYCGSTGCVETSGFPLTLSPGEQGTITIHFTAGDSGPFDNPVTVYTSGSRQPEAVMHLIGNVSQPIDRKPLQPVTPSPAGS